MSSITMPLEEMACCLLRGRGMPESALMQRLMVKALLLLIEEEAPSKVAYDPMTGNATLLFESDEAAVAFRLTHL
jgi:hypothetical protein